MKSKSQHVEESCALTFKGNTSKTHNKLKNKAYMKKIETQIIVKLLKKLEAQKSVNQSGKDRVMKCNSESISVGPLVSENSWKDLLEDSKKVKDLKNKTKVNSKLVKSVSKPFLSKREIINTYSKGEEDSIEAPISKPSKVKNDGTSAS